jgi:hypothetical protein
VKETAGIRRRASKEMDLKGLIAIWTDIDCDFIPEFRVWHGNEHMALRINTKGWHVGHRYQGMGDAPGFLIAYETENVADLGGKAYHSSLNEPDAHTKEALSHYRNAVRTIYGLLKGAGEPLPTDAPCLVATRFAPAPDRREEVIRWISEEHLAAASTRVPGARRVRLYEVDRAVSGIMTQERKIYNANPGEEDFLLTYELDGPDVLNSKAWSEAFSGTERTKAMMALAGVTHRDTYTLEFTIYPSGAKP